MDGCRLGVDPGNDACIRIPDLDMSYVLSYLSQILVTGYRLSFTKLPWILG
jgi:hypothetical protein